MSITTEALRMLERVSPAAKIVRSVETHLLVDQADAVAPGVSEGGTGSSDISDPTFRRIAHLAPYARMERSLRARINAVTKALDELEVECQKIIAESGAMLNGGKSRFADEPRCPGFTPERQSRLGGCGNHPAHWRLPSGQVVNRHDLGYCVDCIRDERAAQGAA